MTALERATNQITGHNATRASASSDWLDLFNALRLLIPVLVKCLPDAIQAHDYFTREFKWWERLIGRERRRDSAINQALANAWKGPRARLPELQARVKWALRNGALNAQLFANAYREWNSNRPTVKDGDTGEWKAR